MINQRNFGIVEGRLVSDPTIRENKDGSHKVYVRIAARNARKNADGAYGVQFVELTDYLPKEKSGTGVYGYLKKGMRVGAEYTVHSYAYTDKSGKKVYGQELAICSIDIKESLTKQGEQQRQSEKGETATTPQSDASCTGLEPQDGDFDDYFEDDELDDDDPPYDADEIERLEEERIEREWNRSYDDSFSSIDDPNDPFYGSGDPDFFQSGSDEYNRYHAKYGF